MRETRVTIHLYQDITTAQPVPFPFDDDQRTRILDGVKGIFQPPQQIAGTDNFVTGLQFGEDIQSQSFGKSDGELAEDLMALSPIDIPAGIWSTRVLIAQSSNRTTSRPRGVMFDIDGRRGCAVFVRPFETTSLPREQLLIRTIAHELGHVFHLAHEDAAHEDVQQKQLQIMFDGTLKKASVQTPAISKDCWEHLLRHDFDSVRPGSSIAFGRRICPGHPVADFKGILSSGDGKPRRPGVELKLRVAPGNVFPQARRPTFVIGEPIHATVSVANRSRRTVLVPGSPETATQDLVIYRLDPDGSVRSLTPPLLFCSSRQTERWSQLMPGAVARFHETLSFRNGELVLPRPGTYRLVAGLRLRKGWLASRPVVVNVEPPAKRRHERSCEMAAEPESGLFVELGTALSVSARERLAQLDKMNPKFPLNPIVRLIEGRQAVLSADPTPASCKRDLAWLAGNPTLPKPVRAEAELLLLLERAQVGDVQVSRRLRRRLAKETRLPIQSYPAAMIRSRLNPPGQESS